MITTTAKHALLALSFLARLAPGEYAGASQIAEEVGAPQNYLGKLLKKLAGEGIVESQKGFGGGFRLAKAAAKISLFDIMEPIDKVSKWNGCFMGRSSCNSKAPCAVHDKWSAIRDGYFTFLRETNVADIVENKGIIQ